MQVLSSFHHSVALTINNYSNDTSVSIIDELNIDEQSQPIIFTILIAFCLSIIILLTIFGNILVLIALCIDFALRSPTHLLMGNLACADLLLGITVLPFSGTLEILHGRWLFGRTFCHIWLSIDVLYCTASIYGLMFISIERYFGVICPLRYPIIITRRRTMYAIVIAWLVAALVSVAPFLGWRNKVRSSDNACEINDDLSYVVFSCSFSFYMPLIVILCVYGRIYGEATRQYKFLAGGQKEVHLKQKLGQETVTLRIHLPKNMSSASSNGHLTRSTSKGKQSQTQVPPTSNNKFSRMKRERKAAKTLGIVVGMFILCWSPFFLLLPIKALTSVNPGILFSICFWLGYCNSCFNPFIYAFSSREFRKAFKSILRCQRIKKTRPSSGFNRASSTTNDTNRRRRSNSWDIQSTRSTFKTASMISRQTSNGSQHHFRSSTKSQSHADEHIRTKGHECITNTIVSIEVSTTNDSSPWHLRKSITVRS